MSGDGWIKLWRCIDESDVWQLPPLAYRIWTWILVHANSTPATVFGIELQPGEMLTSYSKIADGVAWTENKALQKPSSKAVRWALERLSQCQALRHEPRQGGTWIKVLQWSKYQANDEGDKGRCRGRDNNRTTAGPRQDHGTKQEYKKESKSLAHPSDFEAFWSEYPRRVGRGQAEKAYAAARKVASHEEIMAGLQSQLPTLAAREAKYIPHASTWLNGGRWADEVGTAPATDLPYTEEEGRKLWAMGYIDASEDVVAALRREGKL